MDFEIHTVKTAPEASKVLLEDSINRYGSVPNIHGVMAESPAMLEASKALLDIYAKTSLSVLERQLVLLAISFENNCSYCMAGHSAVAKMEKMPDEILTALREGKPLEDTKLEALRSLTAKMTRERGLIDEDDLYAVLEAGYSRENIQEVIVAIALLSLSNYMSHLAKIPTDEAFKSELWSKPHADNS